TLSVFLELAEISQIVIIAHADDAYIDSYTALSDKIIIKKIGGQTRAQSVLNGIVSLNCDANDWVLVHDAARCCLSKALVQKLLAHLATDPVGGILALPASDTIKQGSATIIEKTINRDTVYLAQTPQMFRHRVLATALIAADLALVTDEASAVEQLGLPVKLVTGDATNIKVTYPLDLKLAELFLSAGAAI
ncbi:MAG: 2-C-methyl-D-erythritol 4-phosphate cytidylyltransferase, partial [Burkholderiales bacterium]